VAEGSGFELPVPIVRRENGRFFLISLSPEGTPEAPGGLVMLRRRSLGSLNFYVLVRICQFTELFREGSKHFPFDHHATQQKLARRRGLSPQGLHNH
jgi:hypothetical protein